MTFLQISGGNLFSSVSSKFQSSLSILWTFAKSRSRRYLHPGKWSDHSFRSSRTLWGWKNEVPRDNIYRGAGNEPEDKERKNERESWAEWEGKKRIKQMKERTFARVRRCAWLCKSVLAEEKSGAAATRPTLTAHRALFHRLCFYINYFAIWLRDSGKREEEGEGERGILRLQPTGKTFSLCAEGCGCGRATRTESSK